MGRRFAAQMRTKKVKPPLRKIFRRTCGFLLVCGMVYFSFIGYGMAALPERMTVVGAQEALPQLSPLYSLPMKLPAMKLKDLGIQEANGNAQKANTENETPGFTSSFQFLKILPVKAAKITVAKRDYVVPGGDIFGIKLYTRGVLVAKTDLVATENGNENPAQAAGLRAGDVITEIDGEEVNRKKEVSDAIEQSGGTPLRIIVERGDEKLSLECAPAKSAAGDKYVAGLWIRDSSAGIGTITFYDKKSGTLAGLGHAICDVDTGDVMTVAGGELVRAKIMGCYRGVGGAPGELCGVFEPETLASLAHNSDRGVYGKRAQTAQAGPFDGQPVPVALKSEVRTGPAQALVTVNGKGKKAYDVEIIRVSPGGNSSQKNMTVRVTDPALIEATGGIVQGMSGSPILQNGMLVGAITHVFVNTPLEGYAIFAETMLETARNLP